MKLVIISNEGNIVRSISPTWKIDHIIKPVEWFIKELPYDFITNNYDHDLEQVKPLKMHKNSLKMFYLNMFYININARSSAK